jgi:hypothetical protein
MTIKLFCRSILFLFGTFLHELSHFTVALFLGKPEGFSIVPRIEGDVFIFGVVRARVRYRVLSFFIAAAPLLWWIFLLVVLRHAHALYPETDMQGLGMSRLLEKLRSFSFHDIFSLWLVIQLLWAGRLSAQDIKTCIRGIISISGLVFILLAAFFLQLFRYSR